MKVKLENVLPGDIERRSFEIITEELGDRRIDPENEAVVKRVIHTSADFEYFDNLAFSGGAVKKGIEAIVSGACIVTDTTMARSGISKPALEKFGAEAVCFIADEEVRETAKACGTTRAAAAVDKAAKLAACGRPVIFAVGNAPTALVRLYERITEGTLSPALIIGVPVGFVNVVESKELILSLPVPYIVAKGRKGGSNVAAAIVNAMLYQAGGR